MGLLKKIKKTVKKTVKKVAKAAETVVTSPIKIVAKAATGDFSGAVKQVGKFAGSGATLATGGLLESGDAQKILNNKTLNKLTLGTGRELGHVSRGFGTLRDTGEADKRFYQSGLAIGAKVAGGYAVAAYAPGAMTAKNAYTGVKIAGAVKSGKYLSAIAGAQEIEGVDVDSPEFLNDARDLNSQIQQSGIYQTGRSLSSLANIKKQNGTSTTSQGYSQGGASSEAPKASSDKTLPLMVAGGLALTGVGLPVAAGIGAATLLLNKKTTEES